MRNEELCNYAQIPTETKVTGLLFFVNRVHNGLECRAQKKLNMKKCEENEKKKRKEITKTRHTHNHTVTHLEKLFFVEKL